MAMTFTVEYEQEEDGRWLAEVPELPGVLAPMDKRLMRLLPKLRLSHYVY